MLVLVYSQIRQRAYLVRVLNESSDFQPASAAASCALRLLEPLPMPMMSPFSPNETRAVKICAYSGPETSIW